MIINYFSRLSNIVSFRTKKLKMQCLEVGYILMNNNL